MADSILTNTKQNLGITEDYTVFDDDIIMYINGVFSTLHQLGLGPVDGFSISDVDAVWNDFTADDVKINSVKTYVYLKVRMIFDPPTTSYLISSMNKQIEELEWRLNVYREGTAWVDPDPVPDPDLVDEEA